MASTETSHRSVVRRIVRPALLDIQRAPKEHPVLVEKEKYQWVKSLPFLIEGEGRIRFDPFTGLLYVSSWKSFKDGKEHLDGVRIISPRRGKERDLGAEIIWKGYPSIESAAKMTVHVLEKQKPVLNNTLTIIAMVQKYLEAFSKTERIDSSLLSIWAQEMEVEFEAMGFLDVEAPRKQAIVKQIKKAFGLDSLGRINPLISRTRLSSSLVKLVKEIGLVPRVEKKYSYIFSLLMAERVAERYLLSQAVLDFEDILQRTSTPTTYEQVNNLIKEIKGVCFELFRPDKIKIFPYRFSAMVSTSLLFGLRNVFKFGEIKVDSDGERKILMGLIGDRQVVDALINQKSLEQIHQDNGSLSEEETVREIRERLTDSIGLLKIDLKKGNENLPLGERLDEVVQTLLIKNDVIAKTRKEMEQWIMDEML